MVCRHQFRLRWLALGVAIAVVLTVLGGCALLDLPDGGDDDDIQPQEAVHMYVHTATSGTLVPVAGEEDVYILTLNDVSPQTAYHTDRPEYILTYMETRAFVDGWGEGEPRVALIELMDGAEEADVLAVQLSEPAYDPQIGTLTYRARTISADDAPEFLRRHAEEELATRADNGLPSTFRSSSVYVDTSGAVGSTFDDCSYSKRVCVLGSCVRVRSGCPSGALEVKVWFAGGLESGSIYIDSTAGTWCQTEGPVRVCVIVEAADDDDHVKISVRGCVWALKWHCKTVSMGTFPI